MARVIRSINGLEKDGWDTPSAIKASYNSPWKLFPSYLLHSPKMPPSRLAMVEKPSLGRPLGLEHAFVRQVPEIISPFTLTRKDSGRVRSIPLSPNS